jgi:hypothetical protein
MIYGVVNTSYEATIQLVIGNENLSSSWNEFTLRL